MTENLTAKATVAVDAPVTRVWDALVTPETIKQYMFGTTVISNWTEGSPIVWKGEWQGTSYEDKGVIRQLKPNRVLEYTHFSPLSGLADRPENYHTVRVALSTKGKQTVVSLTQDNNPTEQERDHSQKNWETMLASLKKIVEE
jgi:uncharacterized protein YndB with AHSA1/START domain